MIPKEKIEEIRNYLKKSENPLFFFDDDCDGLCAYLLLKRYTQKGKGIILKTSPNLDLKFVKKVEENSPDIVIILDQPIVSQEFIDNVHVPILWIDHHPIVKRKGIHHYNPLYQDKNDNRPTSHWCYQIAKQDLWVAVTGSVSDWYVPDYIEEVIKKYPELIKEKDKPEKILFETNLGKFIKIVSFLLKGKISEVYTSISILNRIETPLEIVNQTTSQGKYLYKKFEKIEKNYNVLLEKALKTETKDNLFIFTYPTTKMAFSKELSNELVYRMQDKIIIVGREKDDFVKLSIRSMKFPIDKILKKALINIEGYGGGHHYACGANIAAKDFNRFIKNFREGLIKRRKI